MDDSISQKLDNFFKQFKHQVYKKGEILIRVDEDPGGVFYLTKGVVKEYAISKKGEELIINIFKPVSFFPMSWAINRAPNSFYYEALEEIEIWKAPREEVVEFIKANPDILFNLMSRVFKGTDGILMRMVYLMSGEAYARVITELLASACCRAAWPSLPASRHCSSACCPTGPRPKCRCTRCSPARAT